MALVAAAAYPAYRLGGRESVQGMLLGAGLSWMTVVASYMGLVLAFPRAKQLQLLIVIGGFLVRFATLFALLAVVSKTTAVNLSQLVIWLVGFYVVLVIAEAWMLAGAPGRRPPGG